MALADALIGLFSAGVIYSEAPFAEIDGCGTRAPRGGYMLQHLLFQDRRGAKKIPIAFSPPSLAFRETF